MGNKPPHTIKESLSGSSKTLPIFYSCSSMRGCRNEQEDAHTIQPTIEFQNKNTDLGFFAVFDGHSGHQTSEFVSKNLLSNYILSTKLSTSTPNKPTQNNNNKNSNNINQNNNINNNNNNNNNINNVNNNNNNDNITNNDNNNEKKDDNNQQQQNTSTTSSSSSIPSNEEVIKGDVNDFLITDERIKKKFLDCESDLLKDPVLFGAGSAGISTFLKHKKKGSDKSEIEVVCCNVGDSRSIIFDEGKTVPISEDHKPSNKGELQRITEAGHFVAGDRVDGQLALSRSFGDGKYKQVKWLNLDKQAVIAEPEIKRYKIQIGGDNKLNKSKDFFEKNRFQFIVLACDGIWDVMKNVEVTDFISKLCVAFDIFNPNFKVPSNFRTKDIIKDSEKKNDDWYVTYPITEWSDQQYIQWEHTIPTPYPAYNSKNIIELAKEIKTKLDPEHFYPPYENPTSQKKQHKKVYQNILQTKKFLEEMEKNHLNKPYLSTTEEKLTKICELLLDEVVISRNSTDNTSIIIVLIDNRNENNTNLKRDQVKHSEFKDYQNSTLKNNVSKSKIEERKKVLEKLLDDIQKLVDVSSL